MRKIIYLSIITCLLTILSCSDFLELNPNDQLFRENFWQTEKDAQLALTGVYNQLRNAPSYNHGRILWDGLSDAAYSRLYNTIARGVIESTTGSIVSGIYSESYVLIGRCNNFLANIDRVEMDVDEKNKYKGEVLFLRALAYFTLTEFYGGVPLYTAPVTMEEAKVKQSAKEQVIQQVLTDLDQAISYLPDTAYRGHAVKGSALALKAQVLMHNEQWPEAAKTAALIIEKGIFRLSDNYPDLFLSEGQINNPEILFSVRFLNPDAPCNTSIDQNPDLIAAHDLTIEPIQEYIDIFECIDGLPWNESPLYNPEDMYDKRDPRLRYVIRNTPALVNGDPYLAHSWETPYKMEKYVNWEYAPFGWHTRSDQDYVFFRYANVLLMYAESKNEAAGPDDTVYAAINEVRARPGVEMPPLPAGLTREQMRQSIRDERFRELGLEGFRYLDLKRWRIAEKVIPLIQDPSGNKRVFDPGKHYLFPFSQNELDRNPNLEQNPGY